MKFLDEKFIDDKFIAMWGVVAKSVDRTYPFCNNSPFCNYMLILIIMFPKTALVLLATLWCSSRIPEFLLLVDVCQENKTLRPKMKFIANWGVYCKVG